MADMDILTDHGHGIYAIDSDFGRPRLNAVHLIVANGRAALIDSANNRAVPRVLEALEKLGIAPERVDYLILTHVHLDHAGGAGSLMAALPEARLVVHPRGARHVTDPSRLIAGTIAVYGEAAARGMYGDILPVAATRIVEARDAQTLTFGRRELSLFDTPGHARHHLSIRDGGTGQIFAGDSFGLSYRELDRDGRCFAFPATTPVQFDPVALHRSVDLIAGHRPGAVYVTHYSRVGDIPRLAADLHRLIDAHTELALRERDGPGRHQRLKAGLAQIVIEEAELQDWALRGDDLLTLMAMDIELNAQGLGAWLDAA
ncbi:MAG TPA: MBL fold metallo-hydrolase [Rhodocyclaceae bacterium]|nr:MBL fold metallo-hydrolase [Rhodocyclaceae bacterium]